MKIDGSPKISENSQDTADRICFINLAISDFSAIVAYLYNKKIIIVSPLDVQKTNFGRIRFLQCIIGILFFILVIGIFYRQYGQFYLYNKLGNQQCLRRILRPGIRGTIRDRNGHVLATHRDSYCLYVDLNAFRKPFEQFCKKNKESALQREQLWALVNDALLPYARQTGGIPFRISSQKLLQHYRQNILLPLKIAQDLSQQLYAQLLTALPTDSAFQVGIEYVRHYPYGSSACHVLGYVTRTPESDAKHLPGNDLRTFFLPREKGHTGIEEQYDEHLSGCNGGEIWRVTPSGQKQQRLLSIPSINGQSLTLSLDIELQQVCECALGEDRKGSVSVIDLESGGVLAMVSTPEFDLNGLTPFVSHEVFEDINAREAWFNRAVQGLYPPGSTFKALSMSALLHSGIVDEHTTYDCTGTYRIAHRNIRCHKRGGHGLINAVQAIQLSCNPFFIHYGLRLGVEKLHNEACRYRLDQPTGIDLPHETHRLLIPSPQWKQKKLHDGWAQGDTANMTIGQGYTLVTPFKMACFAAALAKNQTFFTPHFAETDANSATSATLPQTALSQKHRDILKNGMRKVGEHYISFVPTALKTGTAQVKVAHENRYTHIGWMIGYAPIDNPEIAFCIQIEQKGTDNEFWGGQVCAPVARTFLKHYFQKEGKKR